MNRNTHILRRALAPTVIVVALIMACTSSLHAEDVAPSSVKVLQLKQANSFAKRVFFGRVTAKQTIDLAFQVDGQITKYPAIEGSVLLSGALIAALDPEPFEINLARAKIAKDQADRALSRVEKLKGTVSKVTIADAATEVALQEVAVRNAEYALARSVLTTPFDALVASREVANFTTIGAGTNIVRLHDMSELRIEINVPEILFQEIGESPNVVLEAKFPASEKRYPVVFREVNAEASQIGQTFQVTVGMSPPEHLLLLPGSSATIHAEFPDLAGGIIVPASAVRTDLNGATSVMRLQGNLDEEIVSETPVEISINTQGEVVVTSGLSTSDTIVAAGVQILSDGQAVRRFTSF